MPVNPPRLEGTLHDEVVAGAANVVHHFLATVLLYRLTDSSTKRFNNLGPGDPRPLAASPHTHTFHRIQHAVRIVHLVNCRRTLRAHSPAAGRVHWIAFELGDLP